MIVELTLDELVEVSSALNNQMLDYERFIREAKESGDAVEQDAWEQRAEWTRRASLKVDALRKANE